MGTDQGAGKEERPAQSGIFKDLPPRLPALMFAEAVWKQIEKKQLPAATAVDTARVKVLGAQLDEAALGRQLFELAAAARARASIPRVRCVCTPRR